jgi:hypothetical protein
MATLAICDRSRSRSRSHRAREDVLLRVMERAMDGGFATGESHGRSMAAHEHAREQRKLMEGHEDAIADLERRYSNFVRTVCESTPEMFGLMRRELRLGMQACVIVNASLKKSDQVLCAAADAAAARR